MKECPNCKAVGKKKFLRYKSDYYGGKYKTAGYVCTYCGFKTKA